MLAISPLVVGVFLLTDFLLGLILLFLICALWFLVSILRRGIPATVTYVIDPGV
jgi:hypothetical protein